MLIPVEMPAFLQDGKLLKATIDIFLAGTGSFLEIFDVGGLIWPDDRDSRWPPIVARVANAFLASGDQCLEPLTVNCYIVF